MREKGEGGSDNGLEGGAGWSERRRPGLPRGVLAGAWRPHGVRVLTPIGALVRASGWRRGGRPGRPVRLGRKGGGGPVRKNEIFQTIFKSFFIQTKF